MVLGEYGDCALGVVEGHVVDLEEVGISLPVELVLPEVDPLLDGVPGLLSIEGLFPHAHQLQGGHVQHLLEGARVVAALDDLEGDAVADFEGGGGGLCGESFVFFGGLVSFLEFFSCLGELVLELEVFLVGPEGVGIIFLVLIFDVLALDKVGVTRLMGLSRNLIFFCSLSSSLPFMPSTSSALFVLFLSYPTPLPLLSHLEGVWELFVRHPGLAPSGLPKLCPPLLRRFALLLVLVLLLRLEVEVGLGAQHLLRFDDGVVGTVLVGPQGR